MLVIHLDQSEVHPERLQQQQRLLQRRGRSSIIQSACIRLGFVPAAGTMSHHVCPSNSALRRPNRARSCHRPRRSSAGVDAFHLHRTANHRNRSEHLFLLSRILPARHRHFYAVPDHPDELYVVHLRNILLPREHIQSRFQHQLAIGFTNPIASLYHGIQARSQASAKLYKRDRDRKWHRGRMVTHRHGGHEHPPERDVLERRSILARHSSLPAAISNATGGSFWMPDFTDKAPSRDYPAHSTRWRPVSPVLWLLGRE